MVDKTVLAKPISELEINSRAFNRLKRMSILTFGDLVRKSEADLQAFGGLGRVSVTQIKRELERHGQHLHIRRARKKRRRASSSKARPVVVAPAVLVSAMVKILETIGIREPSVFKAVIAVLDDLSNGSLKRLSQKERGWLFEALLSARNKTNLPPEEIAPMIIKIWGDADDNE